jgi:hypothetical protein
MEDLDEDGRILASMLENYDGKAWTRLIWLRIGRSDVYL